MGVSDVLMFVDIEIDYKEISLKGNTWNEPLWKYSWPSETPLGLWMFLPKLINYNFLMLAAPN